MVSRRVAIVALVSASGVFLFCSGCNSSQAANAQTPPPQSLSEPVRVSQAAPVTEEPRAVAVSVRDSEPLPSHSPLKVGESRELPTFVSPTPAPAPVPAPKPAAAVAPSNSPADGHYHTLAKGETLSAVSRKYNVRLKSVIDANHFKDPNHLSVGTKVFIPGN